VSYQRHYKMVPVVSLALNIKR